MRAGSAVSSDMNSWTSYLYPAALFFAVAMWRLVEVTPVWWSILTVVILFAASAASLSRALVERRRSVANAASPA
jgi:hypothetical protein